MAFIQDLGTNSISVVVVLNHVGAEESANMVVNSFASFAGRCSLKIGCKVRIKHVEMSREKFDEIARVHSDFSCFRMTRYRALRSRGLLGTICGVTVIERENMGDTIKFLYKDIETFDDTGLIDPYYISAPRSIIGLNHLVEL